MWYKLSTRDVLLLQIGCNTDLGGGSPVDIDDDAEDLEVWGWKEEIQDEDEP